MTILLLSGGIDSLAAWRLMDLPPAVHFHMGTRSRVQEWQAVRWAIWQWGGAVYRRPLDLHWHEKANGYLPHRNAILVLAAAQIDPDVVVAQVAEWAPDKNARFWRRLSRLATQATRGDFQGVSGRVTVRAPYAHLTKGGLLREYAARFGGAEARALCEHTWSCYEAGEVHCGDCAGCAQRWVAEHVAFGQSVTPMAHVPTTRPPRAAWRDGVRWLRDNGPAGAAQMWRRHSEITALND